jgi:phosphatidate phosphatase PAH1
MKLGEGGEAFFVEPCEAEDVPHYLCTSPIPDMDSLMSEGIAKLKKEIKVGICQVTMKKSGPSY